MRGALGESVVEGQGQGQSRVERNGHCCTEIRYAHVGIRRVPSSGNWVSPATLAFTIYTACLLTEPWARRKGTVSTVRLRRNGRRILYALGSCGSQENSQESTTDE